MVSLNHLTEDKDIGDFKIRGFFFSAFKRRFPSSDGYILRTERIPAGLISSVDWHIHASMLIVCAS